MKTFTPALVPSLALAALLAGVAIARAEETRLDIPGIERVEIIGDSASVQLVAQPGARPQARLVERRSGWFGRWYSSWFYRSCRTPSRMWVDGPVLHVNVSTPSVLDTSDCTVEIEVDLPPDVSVSLALAAVDARLEGRFAALDTQLKAGNIALTGAVDRADLRASALRARLDMEEGAPHSLRLEAGALDADVTLSSGASVGWRVDGKATLIDTDRRNDPAGATQIRVNADFLRLSIR